MPGGTKIVLGIGDDAAAWRPSRSHVSVITTDALIEDAHFTRSHFTDAQIGHRALASNLSDIAAMGGRPVLATIALGVPAGMRREQLLDVYAGMNALAKRTNTALVGGDIVRSPQLFLSITVVGEVRSTSLKRRSTARAGDVLAVTGPLGGSRAGFDAQRDPRALSDELREHALAKHCTPEPRLAEGRWLAASHSVHAMMDLSDGLATDTPRLAYASNLGALLEHVPIAASAQAMAQARRMDPVAYTLAAGEDFELLAAIAPRAFAHLAKQFEKRFGRPLHGIGHLREGSEMSVQYGGQCSPLLPAGWDHMETNT
ncbi:MAG: thiamine-phosphate kinase [Candidatus Eremiobacteraeota bacterium]|nr:thiamine-phosphate kinase [Candidatus Eremiobacteraeota bacterium]